MDVNKTQTRLKFVLLIINIDMNVIQGGFALKRLDSRFL